MSFLLEIALLVLLPGKKNEGGVTENLQKATFEA